MDEAAFRAFYAGTARRVRAYLVRACGNDWSLADDLLQDAYYRYLRSGFDSANENERLSYLYRIATNLVRDHHRRRRRVRFEALDAAPEPTDPQDATGERSALAREVSRLLRRLKERDRQLLWLAHVEGLSHEEIAGALDLKATSVRSMLFRARQRLGRLVQERDIDAGVLP